MNSYLKLIKNIVIFSVGSLGSKVISFMLVPLYTHYLSQAEYGTADLVMISVSMILPIVSFAMYESVIRFTINRTYNKHHIINNALLVSLSGFLVFLLLFPLFKSIRIINDNLIYFYVILLIQMLNQILAQYIRGIGKTRKYALSGIITTFFNGMFNILFLVIFDWRLDGYFLASIFAYLLSTIYLLSNENIVKSFKFNDLDKRTVNILLKYSLPLIPNSLMWWLINSSSRYFITLFVGIESNGLFAVSSKIPALINIISQVFSQAWQLSAFEEYDKDNNNLFYSKVFDIYNSILFIATSAIIIVLKPLFYMFFSVEYYISWQPVPFLILGTVFSAASGFIGTAYTASEKTQGVFKTSIYGGVISLALNYILIPKFGIMGAGLSSMISFFLMFIIRFYDTKRIISITINWKKYITILLFILIQTATLFLELSVSQESIIGISILAVILLLNKNSFMYIFTFLKSLKNSKNIK